MGVVDDTKKKNILIVHNYYQIPGGEDSVVANEKKMLEDHGHKVVLYTRSNNELKSMGLLRKLLLPFTTIYNPRTARDVKRIIKSENIDIVHVHNTLNLISPAVYYAALSIRIPVVQTIHNFRLLCPDATFYRDGHICEDCVSKGLKCALKHKCYRGSFLQTLICVISTKIHRMTGIYGKINYICLTEFNKEKLLQLKEIDKEKVFVKPNFVDIKLEIKKERKDQLVFVGRLDKLKGIDLLLHAWKELGVASSKLIVCGTGPLESWCREFVNDNGLNVEMKGFVPNAEALKIISESKALILPTQWYEGFPMTIVEAYSVGTPIICTDIGNCGCVVENGVTGWKFKNKEELIGILNSFPTVTITEQVYEHYQRNFKEGTNYKSLLRIYGECRL